ncbi:hypothetical protein [Dapis sp. BLCC M229]|uniref:hypothetical protein n=1 Tax=Dapis sp. BLCC M229 TaxID=3400188 RepID=UPI003CF394A2
MKFQPYSKIIIALIFFLLGLIIGRFQLTISWTKNESAKLQTSKSSAILKPPLSNIPAPTPLPKSPKNQTQECNIPITISESSIVKTNRGAIRVSNCTYRPLRIALLAKSSEQSYQKSAHWDFAPGEGSSRGLILSLPETKLTLEPGDILVVFAQDGSRLYWGPYVVGETSFPIWNTETSEWQLILRP